MNIITKILLQKMNFYLIFNKESCKFYPISVLAKSLVIN